MKKNLIDNEIVIGMGANNIEMDSGVKKLFMLTETDLRKFGKNLSKNVKLSNYSWFNLGGEVEFFYKAESKSQLIEFLKKKTDKKNFKNYNCRCGF